MIDLNGAWEEPGVIGTRVEIEGSSINILWRNSTVLLTTFETAEKDGGVELILKDKGLCDARPEPYATIQRLFVKDGKMSFVKLFSISGESTEVLKKTDQSRYGDVTVVNDILPELEGKWSAGSKFNEFSIKDGVLYVYDRKVKLIAVRRSYDGETVIRDEDASKYDFGMYRFFEYRDSKLYTSMIIYDAPQIQLTFTKEG